MCFHNISKRYGWDDEYIHSLSYDRFIKIAEMCLYEDDIEYRRTMEGTAALCWFMNMGPSEKPVKLEDLRDSWGLTENRFIKRTLKNINKDKDMEHIHRTLNRLANANYGNTKVIISRRGEERLTESSPQEQPVVKKREPFKVT